MNPEITNSLIAQLMPPLLGFAGTMLAGFLSWAAVRFTARTNIDIGQLHQQNIHRAMMTGITSAIEMAIGGKNPSEIVAAGVAYARQSVPDAIEFLKPSVETLTKIGWSKLEEALTRKADAEVKAAAVAASDAQIRAGFAARQATGAIPPMGR